MNPYESSLLQMVRALRLDRREQSGYDDRTVCEWLEAATTSHRQTQRPKIGTRKQNTTKMSGWLSRVDPTFDELLAKYMKKKVVPRDRPIKQIKSKRQFVQKQRETKLVQKVVQPRSPCHPSTGMSWCFLVYSSSMCCPTQVWGNTTMNPFTYSGWSTISFWLLTYWSDRHGRRGLRTSLGARELKGLRGLKSPSYLKLNINGILAHSIHFNSLLQASTLQFCPTKFNSVQPSSKRKGYFSLVLINFK
jgi:hypothetical protein